MLAQSIQSFQSSDLPSLTRPSSPEKTGHYEGMGVTNLSKQSSKSGQLATASYMLSTQEQCQRIRNEEDCQKFDCCVTAVVATIATTILGIHVNPYFFTGFIAIAAGVGCACMHRRSKTRQIRLVAENGNASQKGGVRCEDVKRAAQELRPSRQPQPPREPIHSSIGQQATSDGTDDDACGVVDVQVSDGRESSEQDDSFEDPYSSMYLEVLPAIGIESFQVASDSEEIPIQAFVEDGDWCVLAERTS